MPEDAALRAAVDRLIIAELAQNEGSYVTVGLPEYGDAGFEPETVAELRSHYEHWVHAGQVAPGEHLLYGHIGFWQHWWIVLHEATELPVRMDIVLPDVPEMDERDWLAGLRTDILDSLVAQSAIDMRLLLPPREEGPVRELADFVAGYGFDVRVRSSEFLFAVYSGSAAVLAERGDDDAEEGYFLSRRPSIVAPLQRVFDDHWASALPWDSFTRGAADILELMSAGWTDARIAQTMGLSLRTVSRRVADAMAAAGVTSRFELGLRYAQARASDTTAP